MTNNGFPCSLLYSLSLNVWQAEKIAQKNLNSEDEATSTWPHGQQRWHEITPFPKVNMDAFSIHACVCSKSLQSCLTLCDPMEHSPPSSSVHGDSPGKNTGVVAMSSSGGSSWPRDWTHIFYVSWTSRQVFCFFFLITSATWESHFQNTHLLKIQKSWARNGFSWSKESAVQYILQTEALFKHRALQFFLHKVTKVITYSHHSLYSLGRGIKFCILYV